MAVYCAEHGLLFIGNKRTGSTAVGRCLEQQLGGRYVPDKRLVLPDGSVISKRHATLEQIRRAGLIDVPLETLLKFTAVRNPFDSVVSHWAKLRFRGNRAEVWVQRDEVPFPAWVTRALGESEPASMHAEFVDGVDVILRFESLASDLNELLRSRGLPAVDLQLDNRTDDRERDYRAYYDEPSRRIVERLFREDLDRYGYVF